MRYARYLRSDDSPEVRQARKEKAAAAAARRRSAAEGYVYAIRFTTGTVKVGETARPEGRLKDHAKAAEAHGIGIDKAWTSKKHAGYHDTEQKLIDFCTWLGVPVAGVTEHFTGIDAHEFDGLCAFSQLTVGNLLRQAYLAKLIAAVNGDMHATWEEAQAALDSGA